jgi:hypothetical protein
VNGGLTRICLINAEESATSDRALDHLEPAHCVETAT